jgi:hypothetical protein
MKPPVPGLLTHQVDFAIEEYSDDGSKRISTIFNSFFRPQCEKKAMAL